MQIPVIKQLAAKYSIPQLEESEAALLEEKKPPITDAGDDEGDQLTNILAAIWVKREMEAKNVNVQSAIRAYSLMVRNSIS